MQFITNPLAILTVANNKYFIQAKKQNGLLSVMATKVIPNDYSGTSISDLYPEDQEIVADYESIIDDAIQLVKNWVSEFLGWPDEPTPFTLKFNSDFYYYSPSKIVAIDSISSITGKTFHFARTYEDVKSDYPDAELLYVDTVIEMQDRAYTSPYAFPITRREFEDALECLPPVSWKRFSQHESFKLSERYSGNITTIYVRIGNEYFKFKDQISLPHVDCLERANSWAPFSLSEIPDVAYSRHPRNSKIIVRLTKNVPGFKRMRSIFDLETLNKNCGANQRHIATLWAGALNGWDHPSVAIAARAI